MSKANVKISLKTSIKEEVGRRDSLAEDKFHVGTKGTPGVVLSSAELVLHRPEVHRHLDLVVVRRAAVLDRIDRAQELSRERTGVQFES